jgi:hypothetical protein
VTWGSREHHRQKQTFVANRAHFHPLGTATTLIFAATWLSAWFFAFGLLMAGMSSMPLRYALAFVAAYGVFFLCVRVWCGFVHWNRGDASGGHFDVAAYDAEGCLWIVAVGTAACVPAFLFWLSGGFAALLEVAFEVAFAGTVVKRLGRVEIVGNWARALLAGTWMHALAVLLVVVGAANLLQAAAPEAETFVQATCAITKR